jgi:hypothetical protein
MQHIYVAAIETKFGDPATKVPPRFRVSDFRNGNERVTWTATSFPIHEVFLFSEMSTELDEFVAETVTANGPACWGNKDSP